MVAILGGCHRWRGPRWWIPGDPRWLVSVEWSSVAAIGGEVLGGGCLVILGGWCRWRGPRWLPSVERSSVAGAGGVLVVPVVSSWWLPSWCPPWHPRQHIAAGHPRRVRTSLLSAAGSLASESKLQGEIDRCDYSNYQLFMCSFRVCFSIAVCQLKH